MGQREHDIVAADHGVSSISGLAEKPTVEHTELSPETEANLSYDDVNEEPELHARTYVALVSMFALNLVQVFALQGPPAVVGI